MTTEHNLKLIIARRPGFSRTLIEHFKWDAYARTKDGRMFLLSSYSTKEKALKLGQKLMERKIKNPCHWFERFINR